MSDKPELTFEEFAKMCEDAGIASDPSEMEQDFRVGGVIADLVDELMDAMEAGPKFPSIAEGLDAVDLAVEQLTDANDDGVEALRKHAIRVAATAVRFAADLCHDEKGNN